MEAMKLSNSPEVEVLEELTRVTVTQQQIVIHNDDVNTFEHVIECLMEICGHDLIQAEQCAWIIHNNGKCSVKRGSFDFLEPRCVALLDRGLSASIQ